MFQVFEKYITSQISLTANELSLIKSRSAEKKAAKRAFILRPGEVSQHVMFITKGFLRLYRPDDKGNEYTLRFAIENSWISDRESYLTGRPSNCYIEAIEDSEILTWRKEEFRSLLQEMPVFKQLMKNLLEKSQVANQDRIFASISGLAEEKYLQFIDKYPTIFNRLPLHMMASYIGVSRETLSRVRRQIVCK